MATVASTRGTRVDGVIFDIDDTLVDTRGAFASALAAVAARYLPDLADHRHAEVLATWRADVGGHYRRYTRGELGYREQRMVRANELHAAFGGPVLDDVGYSRWDEVFELAFSGAWTAHPDAPPVLDLLLAAGVRVGAMTNAGVAYQTGKLERTGLAGRVPLLVGVDTLGVGKPDPRVFLEACHRLGTDPARTAYVGDELDVDALAAVEVGMIGVWVDRPGPRRVPIDRQAVEHAVAAGVHVVPGLVDVPQKLGLADEVVAPGPPRQ